MVEFNRENNPNAALLTMALRSLGYDNISAIEDIIDNALDAEATRVVVKTYRDEGYSEILIADNGFGMTEEILDQAMRLGSDVERDITSELGKFGMGLCTASMSIARRLEVLTKRADSDVILKSVSDIDEIIKENNFVKFLGEADKNDVALFNDFLDDSKSGSIIRLRNCDKLTNKNPDAVAARLTKELGRAFRDYIIAGKKFYVNGKLVVAEDIFMLEEGGKIYSDETYQVIFKDDKGEEHKEDIRVRLGILPDFGLQGNAQRKINSQTQGFYVMRNNREIASGDTLGFYTRHPQFNRFRGEIYFSAGLDELMGVNFTKKRVDLDQSIFDKLNQDLKQQIRAIGNELLKAKVANEVTEISHEESERQITRKAPLLKTPKPAEEEKGYAKRGKKKEDEEETTEKKGRGKDKEERKARQAKQEERVKFIAEHGGKGGYIYESRMQGKTVVIAWNIDHPFYERFVVGTKDDKTLATSIDFLVYSMATAELNLMNDENIMMIENFKADLSRNLNTLLR